MEATLEAGASVARVARRHAVNANQVFYLRKKDCKGRLGKNRSAALPVTLSDNSLSKSGRSNLCRMTHQTFDCQFFHEVYKPLHGTGRFIVPTR